MKIIILFCLFFFYPYIFYAQQQVSFFVEGHADDWQLFMSKNIAEDLSFAKMVIITVTAGDAGHGNLAYGKGKIPYYLAREKGCVYSSKFAIDLLEGEVDEVPKCLMVNVNGHSIAKYVYKNNMVNYFMRLPDGIHGEGAPETGNQSLKRLKLGQISSITAVDNSATYKGWNDLTQTLKTIIQAEKGTDEEVWMNIQSSDRVFNSGDHPDHYYSSMAAEEAVSEFPWIGIVSWMCYRTRYLPGNLSVIEHQNATGLFAAYSWSLIESGYATSFEKRHTRWLAGDYFKITRKPTGGSWSEKISTAFQSAKRKISTK